MSRFSYPHGDGLRRRDVPRRDARRDPRRARRRGPRPALTREEPRGRSGRGPLSVWLACGAATPSGDECPHEEVAHIPAPTAAVLASIKKLQAAVQERRNQERALRNAVGAEVAMGNGDIEAPAVETVTTEPSVTTEGASETTTETAPKTRGRKPRKRAAETPSVIENVAPGRQRRSATLPALARRAERPTPSAFRPTARAAWTRARRARSPSPCSRRGSCPPSRAWRTRDPSCAA